MGRRGRIQSLGREIIPVICRAGSPPSLVIPSLLSRIREINDLE